MTHPFHPLFGSQFELVSYRQAWGEHRVYFYDAQGHLRALAATWTDAVAQNPFVVVAGGRSYFRVEDLARLAELVEMHRTMQAAPVTGPGCKAKDAANVKRKTPQARGDGPQARSDDLSSACESAQDCDLALDKEVSSGIVNLTIGSTSNQRDDRSGKGV